MELNKILQDFMELMKKRKIPCFIFLIKDKKEKPKFIEVIIKRPYRYSEPELIKKIPKTYRGIKIKAL
jgi:hypothetical protein